MDTILGWSTLLITGALVGWLAGVAFGADKRNSLFIHAIGGFVGALISGILFLLIVAPGASSFDIGSLVYALLGAALLSALLRVFTRQPIRLES